MCGVSIVYTMWNGIEHRIRQNSSLFIRYPALKLNCEEKDGKNYID